MSTPENYLEVFAVEAISEKPAAPARPSALTYGSPEMEAAKVRLREDRLEKERLGVMYLGGLANQLTLNLRPVPDSFES